jgi:integrase
MRLPKAEGGFNLAISTANLAASEASTLTNFAIDAELLDRNPFKTLPRGSCKGNNTMVEDALSRQVLDAMQGSEGRLLFALARWGGLRTPSEPTLLRWCDIDWERDRFLVTSPKTAAYEGHTSRWVPIFPDLAPLLDTRFSEAAEGDEYVLPILQAYAANKATNMLRATLRGLGVEPWSRLWHSLRASCQTELEEVFPTHVVCAWLGNSPRVAHGHYLQVTEEHFAKATQKATQQVTAPGGMKVKTTV